MKIMLLVVFVSMLLIIPIVQARCCSEEGHVYTPRTPCCEGLILKPFSANSGICYKPIITGGGGGGEFIPETPMDVGEWGVIPRRTREYSPMVLVVPLVVLIVVIILLADGLHYCWHDFKNYRRIK